MGLCNSTSGDLIVTIKKLCMPFLAKLKIDGDEEINVLHCDYKLTQMTNATGKVTSLPQGGFVNLTIESTKSTDIFDWMVKPTGLKNGEITFYRRDTFSKLKVLSFSDAYCVGYHEIFDHNGAHPMQVSFTISAKKLKLGDSEFENNRPAE